MFKPKPKKVLTTDSLGDTLKSALTLMKDKVSGQTFSVTDVSSDTDTWYYTSPGGHTFACLGGYHMVNNQWNKLKGCHRFSEFDDDSQRVLRALNFCRLGMVDRAVNTFHGGNKRGMNRVVPRITDYKQWLASMELIVAELKLKEL